mmetsp:Transcript_8987/g.26931  ORF Transcript_8987/g.26931 Transcript_8987/m.26931 type:complete len:266 (+) Transcript_8987:616-1413(+)
MLMMCPKEPRRCMSWMASRVHMQTPSTLVDTISTQLAVLPSHSAALLRPSPALFTRMSMPAPGHLLRMMRGSATTSASLVMSHTMGRKSTMGTPALTRACCSCSSRSRRRATATTRNPASASRSHTAHPIPAEAPVTSATLPRHRSSPGSGRVAAAGPLVGCGAGATSGCGAACICGGTRGSSSFSSSGATAGEAAGFSESTSSALFSPPSAISCSMLLITSAGAGALPASPFSTPSSCAEPTPPWSARAATWASWAYAVSTVSL